MKSPLLRSLLLATILAVVAMKGLISCKPSEQISEIAEEQNSQPLTVNEARNQFDKKFQSARSSAATTKYGTPVWKFAKEFRYPDGSTYVQVPLLYKQVVIGLSETAEDTTGLSRKMRQFVAPQRYLIIYRGSKKETRFRAMEMIPTTSDIYKKEGQFTGELSYYDFETGRLLDGYSYENGQKKSYFRTSLGREPLSNSGGRTYQWVYVQKLKCYYTGRYNDSPANPDAIALGHIIKKPITSYCSTTLQTSDNWGNITWTFQFSEIVWVGENVPDGQIPPGGEGTVPGGGQQSIPNGYNDYLNLKAVFEGNKAFLLSHCASLSRWQNLMEWKVPRTVTDRIWEKKESTPWGYNLIPYSYYATQDIENAYGAVVNLDFFSVRVGSLPNGFSSPSQFLNYIRMNINNFATNHFGPYDATETALWNSSNPLGAIVSIDLAVLHSNVFESGSVVVSDYAADHWTFTALTTPYDSEHPVSGNRQFGYYLNPDGSYTFYTSGVDRLTALSETAVQKVGDLLGTTSVVGIPVPFSAADDLWKNFQKKLADYVNANGGIATRNTPEIKRPNWQDAYNAFAADNPEQIGCENN